MIATGGVPARPDVPGADAAGIHGVQTLEDGDRGCLRVLERDSRRRAVVVGAGYIGLEMAEAMISRGLEVTLIDAADAADAHPRPGHGRARRRRAARPRASTCGSACALEGFDVTGGRVTGVRTAERHPARGPRRPRPRHPPRTAPSPPTRASPSARPAGSASTGACAPRAEGVWAAGDCVEVFHLVSQRAGRHRARHPRQQAGPRRRHQHRRRLRHLPRRRRHRRLQDLRVEVARTGLSTGRGGRGRVRDLRRRRRVHHPRRLLPRRPPDHDQDHRRAHAPAACSAPRSSAGRARPSASTPSPSPSGTA